MTYRDTPVFRQMAIAFVKLELDKGFPALVSLAVSACESGWWKHVTGDYNYWGITRAPMYSGDTLSKFCLTSEYTNNLMAFRADERATAKAIPGRPGWVTMWRWFASYPSLDASVSGYVSLITGAMRYHPAWVAYQTHHNPEKLLSDICDAGYATGPAKKVELEIMQQSNVKEAIAMARQEISQTKGVS